MLADARCIAGSCYCLDPGLTYRSAKSINSMYTNSSTEDGCVYTHPAQSFLEEAAQGLPPFQQKPESESLLAPSPNPFLPPPLPARQYVGQVGTNLSRRLRVPETTYALPESSLGAFQRQAPRFPLLFCMSECVALVLTFPNKPVRTYVRRHLFGSPPRTCSEASLRQGTI